MQHKVISLLQHPFYVQVQYGVVRLRGEEYRVGTSVFLQPGSFKFKTSAPVTLSKKGNNKDQKVCIIMSANCRWILSTGIPCPLKVEDNCGKLSIVSVFRLLE
jgi:hypothetical protein